MNIKTLGSESGPTARGENSHLFTTAHIDFQHFLSVIYIDLACSSSFIFRRGILSLIFYIIHISTANRAPRTSTANNVFNQDIKLLRQVFDRDDKQTVFRNLNAKRNVLNHTYCS